MLKVVAALIEKEDTVLIARRSTGDPQNLGKWEFPGGKVEALENDQEALAREILEEFEVSVNVQNFIMNSIFEYPDKTIDLRLYHCVYLSGEFHLHDHSEYRFVSKRELLDYDFAQADVSFVKFLMEKYL